LFYDFVSSYEDAHRFDHLPTPEEISRQVPNTNGWGTGMEDSTITAGVLLAAICDRYTATHDLEALRPDADRIFAGLHLCGTLSRAEGLVLRSVSPADGHSHYIETSRDQLTHFAHGIWRYYHSALSTDPQRAMMRDMMAALCRRLERYVVPARDYHVCKENDDPGLVDKMWNVDPHEMARLPMIFGVGWELTGDERWHALYEKFVGEALKQAEKLQPEGYDWCYALFQHQVSLEGLASLPGAKDEIRQAWKVQMKRLGESVGRYARQIHNYTPVDVASLDMMDWHTRPGPVSAYGKVPEWPAEMVSKEYRPLRELGEALLIKLMSEDAPLDDAELGFLKHALTEVDYDKTLTCAMLYPMAAYWRYRANQNQTTKRTESGDTPPRGQHDL
jgi:hypothetical protein